MGSNDPDQITLLSEAMANRLRWSSGNAEEFVQAAATQLVFNHWRAFAASLGRRHEGANHALRPTR
jgi:hypothetical protein